MLIMTFKCILRTLIKDSINHQKEENRINIKLWITIEQLLTETLEVVNELKGY